MGRANNTYLNTQTAAMVNSSSKLKYHHFSAVLLQVNSPSNTIIMFKCRLFQQLVDGLYADAYCHIVYCLRSASCCIMFSKFQV